MTWIIMMISIAGVVLNARKHWFCFVLWLVTNGYWAVHNYRIGQAAQSFLFTVYFGLTVYGLWNWKLRKDSDGSF